MPPTDQNQSNQSSNELLLSIALAIQNAFGSGAVTLGISPITTPYTASSTALQDVTGLSLTVTVPNGGRRMEVEFYAPQIYSSIDANRIDIVLEQDGVEISARYDRTWSVGNGGNGGTMVKANFVPSAGAHTYKIRIRTGIGAGVGTVYCAGADPAYLTARLI